MREREMSERPTDLTPPAGTTARTLLLLKLLAEARGDVSIKELSLRTNLPPSTLHRLLQLLLEGGMASFDADHKRYGIGPEFLRVAALVGGRRSIADSARPHLEAITAATGETSCLIAYVRPRRVVTAVLVVNSPHPLQYKTELFTDHTLLLGATGQSILAFLPEEEREQALADFGPDTLARLSGIPDRAAYVARLDRFRAQGYALTQSETIEGAVGIGAPVFDHAARVVASICVTVPKLRFTPEIEETVVRALKPEAALLSAELGHRA